MPETNSYSEQWFRFFQVPITEERTEREVQFVCAVAPLPAFSNVLDVCCGSGRHARALAARGYSVTGIDRDAAAISEARESGGGPNYFHADARDYEPAYSAYDLAIVMGQSFGYFDTATNREWLARLAKGVRHGGKIILDLWNSEFFLAHQGERILETGKGNVREVKWMEGGRLFVELTYPNGASEAFEWQLFTPEQMRALGESVGLTIVVACTDFDSMTKPNRTNPRLQFAFERL